jgi:hypothetical protein
VRSSITPIQVNNSIYAEKDADEIWAVFSKNPSFFLNE